MPNNPTTPELATGQFVPNLLGTLGYWEARALAAETECETYKALYHQAIAVGGQEHWFLLGQVLMEEVPTDAGVSVPRMTAVQTAQAAGIFESIRIGSPIPIDEPGGSNGTRNRSRSRSSGRGSRSRSSTSGGSGGSTGGTVTGTTSGGGGSITDQAVLDKRRAAMAKARQARSEKLALQKAEREGATAGA